MAKTMAKLQARAKKTSGKKTTASRLPKAGAKQKFNVNHFRARDFRTDGLRSYARYRDLGMSKATKGLLQAHVIRLVPPMVCTDAEIDQGLAILDEVFAGLARNRSGTRDMAAE